VRDEVQWGMAMGVQGVWFGSLWNDGMEIDIIEIA